MSRTYRNGLVWGYKANRKVYTQDEYWIIYGEYCQNAGYRMYFGEPPPCHGWSHHDQSSKRCRDGKGNNGVQGSAPRWYKTVRRRRERRQVRQAIFHERDMPRFKNSDAWYW